MVEVDKENSKWQEMAARRRQYIRTFFVSVWLCIWFGIPNRSS